MKRRLQHESLENRQMLTGVTQISGTATFVDEGICAEYQPSEEYGWYTMEVAGDLQGCWYTKTPETKDIKDNGQPSGIYQESSEEWFIELDESGTPTGNEIKFTYFLNSKYNAPVHGRCQHRIVEGTGVFEDATGWVFFKDEAGVNAYRGHIKYSDGGGPSISAVDAAIAASLEADDDSQDDD